MQSKLNWQEVPPDQFAETFIEGLYDKIEVTLFEEEEREIYYEARLRGWSAFGKTPADAVFNLLDKITSQIDFQHTFINKEQ